MIGNFYPQNKIEDIIVDTGINQSEVLSSIEEAKVRRKSRVFNLKNEKNAAFEILVELFRPKIKVVCIGDNYDVIAFISIVHELGWEVHVAGKKRKLSKDVFNISTSVSEYSEADRIPIDEHTAVILMSHDYKTDYRLLKHFIHIDLPYIGLLGPKKRMLKMQDELAEEGLNIQLENRLNLFSPVGLDVGAESPEEIALSVAAEIVATLRRRDGTPLRKREGPIHERD